MIVEPNLRFPYANRNSSLRKDSKTILLVALLAGLHVSSICKETKATALKDKCLKLFVTNAAVPRKFLSSLAAQSQFTAVIALAVPDNIVNLNPNA